MDIPLQRFSEYKLKKLTRFEKIWFCSGEKSTMLQIEQETEQEPILLVKLLCLHSFHLMPKSVNVLNSLCSLFVCKNLSNSENIQLKIFQSNYKEGGNSYFKLTFRLFQGARVAFARRGLGPGDRLRRTDSAAEHPQRQARHRSQPHRTDQRRLLPQTGRHLLQSMSLMLLCIYSSC